MKTDKGIVQLQTDVMDSLNATIAFQYGVQIDPTIVSRIPFDSPMLDFLESRGAPLQRPDLAATFGLLTSADFTASQRGSFPVGGDPPHIDIARSLMSIPKKSYGAAGGVKDVNRLASTMGLTPHQLAVLGMEGRFRDDAALLVNLLYVRTRESIDYGIVKGDALLYPTDFDGLETQVIAANGSQILDAAGSTDIKGYLNDLIVQMLMLGLQPTALACNPLFKEAILSNYGSGVQVIVNSGDPNVAVGWHGGSVVTPAGTLPIITDRRFTVTGAAPTFTGDVFVVVDMMAGERILYPEWQVLPVALDLARVPGFYTSQFFAVWSHLTLVEKSGWYAQGRVLDLCSTFRGTVPTKLP